MQTWTTSELPEHQRFGYWREVLCQAFITLDPRRTATGGAFWGHVDACPLSVINVTTVSSTSQTVARGRSEIRRTPSAYYFLNLQLKGQCLVSQGGREELVKPGEFTIVDTTEPYLLDYRGDWEVHSFRLPRHALHPLLHEPETAAASVIGRSSGLGRIAIDLLASIACHPDEVPPLAADSVVKAMMDVVALSLGATPEARSAAGSSTLVGLRNAIIKYLETNYADATLCVDKVAQHFGVSKRYVHKAFEGTETSFAETLRSRRLDRCAAEIVRPGCSKTISQIAFAWGFNEISNFNHAFRRRFGLSPSEMRSEAGQGQIIRR